MSTSSGATPEAARCLINNLINRIRSANRTGTLVLLLCRKMDYKSRRWKRIREGVLRRDGYLCQISLRYGKHIEADTVHHIFPVDQFPEFQWETWNMISLAGSVHNRMHVRDSQELTEEGRRLMERTARRRNMQI